MSVIPKTKFMWVLVLVLAYAYYQEYQDRKKYAQPAESSGLEIKLEEKKQNSDEKADAKNTVAAALLNKISENETGKVIVDALLKKSLEDKYGTVDIGMVSAMGSGDIAKVDSVKGTGAILSCGAEAVVNYEAFNAHGIKIDSTNVKDVKTPVTFTTGAGQVIKGLEDGIVGMREGGTRKIYIPAKMAFDDSGFTNSLVSKGEAVVYNVELVSIKEGPYKTDENVSIISEESEGKGRVLCGESIKIKYSFLDENGAAIEGASGEAEFVTGSGSMPLGIEFAVQNMAHGGKKTVQIPSSLLKSVKTSILPSHINFKEGEVARVQIEVIEK